MALTKLSLDGNTSIIPAQKEFGQWRPVWGREIQRPFLQGRLKKTQNSWERFLRFCHGGKAHDKTFFWGDGGFYYSWHGCNGRRFFHTGHCKSWQNFMSHMKASYTRCISWKCQKMTDLQEEIHERHTLIKEFVFLAAGIESCSGTSLLYDRLLCWMLLMTEPLFICKRCTRW